MEIWRIFLALAFVLNFSEISCLAQTDVECVFTSSIRGKACELKDLNLGEGETEIKIAEAVDSVENDKTDILHVTTKTSRFHGVPKGILNHFVNLGQLDFDGVALQQLDAESFDPCAKLDTLNLSINQINVLPQGVFILCFSLKEIDLTSNEISSIDDEAFKSLAGLKNLQLGYNQIGSLNPKMFKDLSKLEILNLHSNLIENLPENLFENLEQLVELKISENKISSIGNSAFSSLTKLETLTLKLNHLGSVSKDVFEALTSLDTLDLSENYLNVLEDDLFKSLVDLKTLNLANNNLTIIYSEPFEPLSALRELDLSSNNISAVDEKLIKIFTSFTINLEGNICVDDTLTESSEVQLMEICYESFRTAADPPTDSPTVAPPTSTSPSTSTDPTSTLDTTETTTLGSAIPATSYVCLVTSILISLINVG